MSDVVPQWAVPIATALIAAPSGWFAARAARKSGDHSRIQSLERRVDRVEARNMLLWVYCRSLVDHIYEGKGAPPPPMSAELMKMMGEP